MRAVLIGIAVLAVAGVGGLLAVTGVHKVDEGHVGVYYWGGALIDKLREPGYHWSMPFLSSHVAIPVRLQTTTVNRVECGTAGGVVVYFDAVEVVHRLRIDAVLRVVREHSPRYADMWIHDRLHWEVNQLCSKQTLQEIYIERFDKLDESILTRMNEGLRKFTPGLEVLAVRITKPHIPDIIRVNYEKVEELKTALLVEEQHSHNVLREEETHSRKAVMEAEKMAGVSLITMERKLNATVSRLEIVDMEAQMHFERQKQRADARSYQLQKHAQSNKLRLTPKLLQLMRSKNVYRNTKLFLGDNVPKGVIEESLDPPPSTAAQFHRAYEHSQVGA